MLNGLVYTCVCRRGHDDLGDHYLDCGDLTNALKCYSRARDYCTNPKHVVNMCLNVIKVSQVFVFVGICMFWKCCVEGS